MCTDAKMIAEMMAKFNETKAKVKARYPDATSEEVFRMTSDALNKSLGLATG